MEPNDRLDNDHLLEQIEVKLGALKEAIASVIAGNCAELHSQIQDVDVRVNRRLDSIDRKVSLHAGALAHIVEWSSKVEGDVVRISTALLDVERRLAKLEGVA